MCGIAGFLADRPDGAILRRMCQQLFHRGPDGEGSWLGDQVALGHRRLSIIDVDGGAQPLGNETGDIQIVCNGEIYNYRELKRRLIESGHRFATRSDTEVIVHLYEEVGDRVPEFLQGMFAFAIWDAPRKELFLARDRLGEKPLYYTASVPGFRFSFASELKALTILPGFSRNLDLTALADYLALSYVPDPKSIYAGVSKLPPAHSLTVTASGFRLRRYWRQPFSESKRRDFDQSVDELGSLAQDAVGRQMMSDVPLGSFLSGGLDSSSIAALAATTGRPLRTFSIGFTSDEFDERPFARMVAARHHTEHREQVVTPVMEEALPVLAHHYDEPFADSSAVPVLYLAKMARESVTAALSGDGADEVFAGYRHHVQGLLEDRIRGMLPAPARRILFGAARQCCPDFQKLPRRLHPKAFFESLTLSPADAYFNAMSAFRDAGLARILAPDIRARLGDYSPREQFHEKFHERASWPLLDRLQSVDMETYLAGDILVKMDRATMAHSLESRAPWLDHRIVEFAGSLPAEFKLRGRKRKFILKTAMSPYLPPVILNRRKKGFEIPLDAWLRSNLTKLFEEKVFGAADHEPLFDSNMVRLLWNEHQAQRRNHGRKLWTIFVLAMWGRHWLPEQPRQS